ncbi:hypothetical protein [Vampirovibrio sp.]|uniref:hypothetical protein n=1 Tax=Vampirovibrio sp. TaxID=2717857 RepID=UPI003593555E
MQNSNVFKSLFVLSCFGFLAFNSFIFTGCANQNKASQEETKEDVVSLQVMQLDQWSKLDDKIPDGQYLVAKVQVKNLSNKTLVMPPADFALQNITDDEKDRYSQPVERYMTLPFANTYGTLLRDKLIDTTDINLYPRMELERYFIFMVPSNAKAEGYQLTYVPEAVSAPLVVTGITTIHDHRNTNDLLPTE